MISWVSFAMICAKFSAVTATCSPDSVTAFVNVSVIPMDRERVLTGQTVLVRGNRITAIGSTENVIIPAHAIRIDGRGKFLIPGLADMHMHFFRADDRTIAQSLLKWLANGVTTVRNMDWYGDSITRRRVMQARAVAETSWSPRIYTSGPWSPRAEEGNADGTPLDSVAQYVAAYKAAGYDFIKIYSEKGVLRDTLVSVARRLGIPVAGHVLYSPVARDFAHTLSAGYASIEHLLAYIESQFSGQSRFAVADLVQMRAMAAATQRAGIWNTPTVALFAAQGPVTDGLPARLEMVRALQDAGAGLLVGSDATAGTEHDRIPGVGVHLELQGLVGAGLTPYQALVAGTRNAAACLGTLDSSGTVAVGKRADLVLLADNPLQDIRHTVRPVGVMIGGRWLARAEIDIRVSEVVPRTTVEILAPKTPSLTRTPRGPYRSFTWEDFYGPYLVEGMTKRARTIVLWQLALPEIQQVLVQQLENSQRAARQALADSLAEGRAITTADHQRVYHLVVRQLQEARAILGPEQAKVFDAAFDMWKKKYADPRQQEYPDVVRTALCANPLVGCES